jgi:hypothetical protein
MTYNIISVLNKMEKLSIIARPAVSLRRIYTLKTRRRHAPFAAGGDAVFQARPR